MKREGGPGTYVGYSVNLSRRLRQHRQIIKGGAKCTSRWCGKLHPVCHIENYPDKRVAMSAEWWCKRRKTKFLKGMVKVSTFARLNSFLHVLNRPKFKCLKEELVVVLHTPYIHLAEKVSEVYQVAVKTCHCC